MTIPASVIDRLRADARQIAINPSSTTSLRILAWRFLKQWGA
jgi:hypothetical protein